MPTCKVEWPTAQAILAADLARLESPTVAAQHKGVGYFSFAHTRTAVQNPSAKLKIEIPDPSATICQSKIDAALV